MSRETKQAKVGGWLALALSSALVVRVVAIDNPEALVIVAPALVGSLLAVIWPGVRGVSWTAVVLIGVTAVFSLIGWVGLLFVPSLVLLGSTAVGLLRTRSVRT
jgi:hypothetical protein